MHTYIQIYIYIHISPILSGFTTIPRFSIAIFQYPRLMNTQRFWIRIVPSQRLFGVQEGKNQPTKVLCLAILARKTNSRLWVCLKKGNPSNPVIDCFTVGLQFWGNTVSDKPISYCWSYVPL